MSGIEDTLLVAISTDFLTQWSFWIVVGIFAGIYGLLALGLQLNVGYTGILNFGQAGFMAIGAYSAVILVVDVGLDYWAALPLSMVITVLAGVLVGLPALRLRGDYLAIATIAFSEMIRITAKNSRELTGGNQGTLDVELDNNRYFVDSWVDASGWITDNIVSPIGLTGQDFVNMPLLLVTWVTLGALAIVLTLLVRSPWGRVLRAIREDEDAARALGKNAFLYKLQSLGIAAGLGAIAGWFLVLQSESVNQESFQPLVTFLAYAVLVLGGLASFGGVLVGTVIFWFLLEGLREIDLGLDGNQIASLRFIVAGLVLILLMAFRPQGVFGKKEEMVLGE